MSFFNDAQTEAFRTGKYICSECGRIMLFEDDNEDVLVCPACGDSVDLDRYGFASDEEYEALYPTLDELVDNEDSAGESYEEVYGELSED